MADVSNEISFAGEIQIEEVSIITSTNNTFDISGIIADLTMFEDIFSNTMSGYVIVEDAMDLISNLPLVGQEILRIIAKTPTLNKEKTISKDFYIYKLQGKQTKKRSQLYVINFCSVELIQSTNSKIAKSFSGKISDTVKNIFNAPEYMNTKSPLNIESTKNSYTFIAPYWTPLETINWLTGKSMNAKGVANYLFFETNKSFEFKSIDTLIKADPIRDYVFSDIDATTIVGTSGDIEAKYNIVQSVENATTFDYLRNLSAGMYASKLYTFDLTTKTINTSSFDYIKDFDKSSHLNKFPAKSDTLPRKKVSSLYFVEKNNYQSGAYKPQGHKDFFLQRNSLLEQITAFKFVIKVHGRTDIKAGDTINFVIPSLEEVVESEIQTKIASKHFSGKYLITAIRHQIIAGVHAMFLEIVSDSLIKKVL